MTPRISTRADGEGQGLPRPAMVACKTHIALGHAAQDTSKGHGALTDATSFAAAKKAYGWPHGPFEVPADIKASGRPSAPAARRAGGVGDPLRALSATASRRSSGAPSQARCPSALSATIRALKKQVSTSRRSVATRKASEMALEVINPILPETIGGSADLTGSNNTKTADLGIFEPRNRKGRYVYYGIREHGMAAAMNGMALHGGVRPYGGTFMCFADYARPSMRLSALMGLPVQYVMTHDSIGLGEDGPTHQPVEHLAMLRATPNMLVFRPATRWKPPRPGKSRCRRSATPSVLALSRQNLPTVRTEHKTKNLTAQGAYVLAEAEGKRQALLMATGSEVAIAMAARDLLQAEGIGTRVVSMPCWELFEEQDEAYRRRVLPAGPGARRGRGRDPLRLGPLALRRAGQAGEIGLRRHARLRRLGPAGRSLRAFRHHGRGRGGQGEVAPEIGALPPALAGLPRDIFDQRKDRVLLHPGFLWSQIFPAGGTRRGGAAPGNGGPSDAPSPLLPDQGLSDRPPPIASPTALSAGASTRATTGISASPMASPSTPCSAAPASHSAKPPTGREAVRDAVHDLLRRVPADARSEWVMIDPPTQSMASVPTIVSVRRKPGMPRTIPRPSARPGAVRPSAARCRPTSSAFTISATEP
jgi:transketolase C-terminal domain/subunit